LIRIVHKPRFQDVVLLTIFSWIGVLVRIGFSQGFEETHLGANVPGPINSDFYSNIVGSAIMGLAISQRERFADRGGSLFVGLTTGLCGSITTFSSLSQQASLSLISHQGTNFVLMLLVGFVVPYWSLIVFFHSGSSLFPIVRPPVLEEVPPQQTPQGNTHQENQDPQRHNLHIIILPVLFSLTVGIFAMLAVLTALFRTSFIPLSCLLAPFGTLSRWILSKHNVRFPRFPVFTFIVNILGSVLLAVFYLLRGRVSVNGLSFVGLSALMTGFCGCLTTVSTFVNESRQLGAKDSWIYACSSVILSQILLLIINGPYYWTR